MKELLVFGCITLYLWILFEINQELIKIKKQLSELLRRK